MSTKPKRTRKLKAQELPAMTGPGVERVTNKAIENAADEYVELRDSRIATGLAEQDAKKKLLGAMNSAGLKIYDYDGKIVTVSPKDLTENVRVKKKDAIEVGEGEGGDE